MRDTPTRNTSDPDEGDVHVMPMDREHSCSPGCWCEPEVDYVASNGNKVWLHKELQ